MVRYWSDNKNPYTMSWAKHVLKDHYKVQIKKTKGLNKFNKKYVIRKVRPG
jgi:hypothetical protein